MTKVSNSMACVGVALLAWIGTARADDDRIKACFALLSNAEQRDCLHALYRTASVELEETYRQSIEHLAGPGWAERVAASQKAWEAYREAECWGVVGQPGGSGSRTWAYGCLAEKTFERTRELKVPFDRR